MQLIVSLSGSLLYYLHYYDANYIMNTVINSWKFVCYVRFRVTVMNIHKDFIMSWSLFKTLLSYYLNHYACIQKHTHHKYHYKRPIEKDTYSIVIGNIWEELAQRHNVPELNWKGKKILTEYLGHILNDINS